MSFLDFSKLTSLYVELFFIFHRKKTLKKLCIITNSYYFIKNYVLTLFVSEALISISLRANKNKHPTMAKTLE